MSKIIKGLKLNSLQVHRFMALEGYVFGALCIRGDDVGTIENMVNLVNDVFESSIVHEGNVAGTIDEMWGYVSGLTRGQRKTLRRKNLTKVPYAMKGAMAGRRQAMAQKESFYSKKETEARQARDKALLESTRKKYSKKKSSANAAIAKKADDLCGPTHAAKEDFYKSWEWRTARMEVLKEHGRACQCCGAEPGMKTAAGEPVRICVDHIKPISKHWGLRLDKSNLQVLCDECNMGKGNWDETDFRPPSAPDEWIVEDQNEALSDQLRDWTTGRLLQ